MARTRARSTTSGEAPASGAPSHVAPGTRRAPRSASPTLRVERRIWRDGVRTVCGIDEVGRGSWAGPVTVCALVAPDQHLRGVRDSKLLTADERERCARDVRGWAVGFGVGHASPQECDELGMTAALRMAAERALKELEEAGCSPDRIVLDGKHNYLGDPRVETIVKADMTVLSVAAASVIAKVTRDALMIDAAEHYPAYGFDANKGYPAPEHKRALAGYGPSAIHRRSWVFMDWCAWPGLRRYERPVEDLSLRLF